MNVQPSDHVLEIGYGPGLAIAAVARLAPKGRVVGIDHSALMIEQAGRRNRSAIEAGLVDLKLIPARDIAGIVFVLGASCVSPRARRDRRGKPRTVRATAVCGGWSAVLQVSRVVPTMVLAEGR